MTKSTHNIESAKTKNALLNITDSPNILPTHDLLEIKKHLLQYVRVGNLPQHIDNASTLKNELAMDVKGFIKMYAVQTEGGFVFPSSYVGLFMDYLNRNNTLETVGGGLERRSGGIKTSPTGESSGEKVRVLFLDFILFCVDFTDILFFLILSIFVYISYIRWYHHQEMNCWPRAKSVSQEKLAPRKSELLKR